MLNPVTYTENIIKDFLRYQLTAYPFADPYLYDQMKNLLNLEHTRNTPLMKGPYISLSQAFRTGAQISDLIDEGLLHPHMRNIASYETLFGHQESSMRAILSGKSVLISTGTGSGKTECFLYPIISRCLELRDKGAESGIVAVIVYPMNALAEDQIERMRGLLAGQGITFGMYIGSTPEYERDVAGVRLPEGSSREDFLRRLNKLRSKNDPRKVHPPEERASREMMRTRGKQPRILLTNVKQLELLLTRHRDIEMFDNAYLEYLVFDEAHTYSGVSGAETACLIRRLRTFCGKNTDETVCVATSATIADPEKGVEAGKNFASRFFGVPMDKIEIVGEEYEPDIWADKRTTSPPLTGDPLVHLNTILDVVKSVEVDEPSREELLRMQSVFQILTGSTLYIETWQTSLYDKLSENELAFQIAEILKTPKSLNAIALELKERVGREVPEEEILLWLALGALSLKNERPLLRPVIHCFIKGVSGGIVTFLEGERRPRLWLSAEDIPEEEEGLYKLPVLTCRTCGQHYFIHHVNDFEYTGNVPGGGIFIDGRTHWEPLEEQLGGNRVVLFDRLITEKGGEEAEGEDTETAYSGYVSLFMCRYCGSLHLDDVMRCDHCGKTVNMVVLYVVQPRENQPGFLSMCVSCRTVGRDMFGNFREPAKSVRAFTVSDVHVIAQSMIHHAQRKRLLVFADNRQDAAFQAGWMQDHARRYRLRSLMYQRIREAPVSIGDLTAWLDEYLDNDDDLSRALIPEVWQVARKESAGEAHAGERKKYIRIQILRELTMGARQRIGLEPWGRMRIDYQGLSNDNPFIIKWAEQIDVQPSELMEGIASLLDISRRSRILLDREYQLYSKFWNDGDREIQRGYFIKIPGGPKGLKLRRESNDNENYVKQLISTRGQTRERHFVLRWVISRDDIETFFEELWHYLCEEVKILVPATLTNARNRPLPGCTEVVQVDADKIVLSEHRGVYRCDTCRAPHVRSTPQMACTSFRCSGILKYEEENPDDYDLKVLDQDFSMIRPREHSAQIQSSERETIERIFKGDSELINTLVCTPTLELGVNIGTLDAILMRNVPPLPANYWQRAGRAGRVHRMAVNVTYARPASHDRAYFSDPVKMLEGVIEPPHFNLLNDLMIRKHVHAAVLTMLFHMGNERSTLSEMDRNELNEILSACFPTEIKHYLFDENGNVRQNVFDVSMLNTILVKNFDQLFEYVQTVFTNAWPEADSDVVQPEILEQYIFEMSSQLQEVIGRLDKRLKWAMGQITRLNRIREEQGALSREDEPLYNRCYRLIKKMKGELTRTRRQIEGYDDTYTYAALAAESFLPGYGLETGAVIGTHMAPLHSTTLVDWDLRRGNAIALREYIPGNLIYANGHKFIPKHYHLEPEEQETNFIVDINNEAVAETGIHNDRSVSSLAAMSIKAVPICDVDLPHRSQIFDEEDYRFQLPVTVYGYEQPRHSGGKAYQWGDKLITFRKGVYMRLVNIGPASRVRNGTLGYPVCLACGQSESPLASERAIEVFGEGHLQRCGVRVENIGFYADIIADAITLQDCEDRFAAYSIMETIRKGASHILDMEIDDLQLLAVGKIGEEKLDMILYDPMPGGSGLLEQMLSRWDEVVQASLEMVENCASRCETACIDCLFYFRNVYYQRYLNRHIAIENLKEMGYELLFSHDIPPRLPEREQEDMTVNVAESSLKAMLERAGFSNFITQHEINLGRPIGLTYPDFFFEDPSGRTEGVVIYLDGMSKHIHGNTQTQRKDREIRNELRSRMFEVIEIPFGELTDSNAMRNHFYRMGRLLLGRDDAEKIRNDMGWFGKE